MRISSVGGVPSRAGECLEPAESLPVLGLGAPWNSDDSLARCLLCARPFAEEKPRLWGAESLAQGRTLGGGVRTCLQAVSPHRGS